ncbi:MAG: DUF1736 domain-containing protein [Chloroflexi bacterium]|nr:DUF1736 domain-containing protein [Chloroflexota bacterium]
MDLGSILFMVALAYGLGVLWYDLLPISVSSKVWRLAAYPFLGIFAAEALLAPSFKTWDWSFGGIHLVTVLVGSLVAVVVDWAIQQVRHPAAES